MANEILYSGTGDLVVAAVIHAEILALVADRGSIVGLPQVLDVSSRFAPGSTVQKIGQAGLFGYDKFAAVAENTDVGNTDITHSSVSITLARQSIQRSLSGLLGSVNSVGLDTELLAQSMVGEGQKRVMEMLATSASGFTDTVGSSGVDMSLDDFVDALNALELKVAPGPFLALLHPVQYNDLRTSLLGAGGTTAFTPATAEMIAIKGPGYKGMLYGVDVYTSDQVPTADAGANRAGALMGAGALAMAIRSEPIVIPGATQQLFSPIVVAYEYSQGVDQHVVTGRMYAGTALVEQARGVLIKTDA